MPSINGLTNPFENSILTSNLTQLEKEKQTANYAEAISQGYEPPENVLEEINSILAADTLSPEAETRLQELLDQIIAEIGPVITSDGGGESASLTLDENTSVVTTVTADDRYSLNGSDSLTYSIIGGADASLFSIDATSGLLTFKAPPDYEAPIAGDNIYDVVVQVNDGAVLVDTQALQITIADVNDSAPVITSTASVTIDENATAVTTVNSSDIDTVGTVTYSITGGDDAVHFLIDAGTGVLTIGAQDFEAPADANADHIYQVEVTASDGVQSDVQLLNVTIADVDENEAPTVVAVLSSIVAEDGPAYSLDLLEGASDANVGDTANLSVHNLTGLVAGITLNGNKLNVDPTNASFQHLAVGQSEIITVNYDIRDTQGASVAQSATITIEGTNDAPRILGGTSVGSVLVNNDNVWDSYSYFGQGLDVYASGQFFAGDTVLFDITGVEQTGVTFQLQGENFQPLEGEASFHVGVNQQVVYSYTLTADQSLLRYRADSAGVGGNPGWNIDASVISGGLNLAEDTTGLFTGLAISDPDAGSSDMNVTLEVANGDLALISIAGLNLTDADGSDGTLVFSGALADVNAALMQLQYTGNQNYNGTDFLNIGVVDSSLLGDSTSVIINVAAVNDAPVAVDGTETLDEDTVLPASVSASDIDGDALIFTLDTQASNGTVAMLSDGTYTYTPDLDFNGADSFVFQVSDGIGGFDIGNVDLTISPVADGFAVNSAATAIGINYLRGLTFDPGHAGTTFQNVGGVAFDNITGKVYESAGYHRYNENYVRIYDDAANFEAGTFSQTLSLGNQIDISLPSDIVGTYFAAHNGQLIGRSSLYGTDYSSSSAHAWDVGFWNASTGAMNTELTVNPNADFSGLNWGGYNAMNVMNDGDNVYALSRYNNSGTWQLAELDTTTNSVIATENINLGSVGYAFVVEDYLFIGSTYSSGVVSRAYDIENNVMHNVNQQFEVPGNIYWSNTSYDSVTDSLYLVSSPNTSDLGELYEVENISDYLFV